MKTVSIFGVALAVAAMSLAAFSTVPTAQAAVRVTLKSGFSYDCLREVALSLGGLQQNAAGQQQAMVRLYLISDAQPNVVTAAPTDYIDVPAREVASVDTIADPVVAVSHSPNSAEAATRVKATQRQTASTQVELHQILAKAGQQHHIDEDLLASVVKAESGGQPHAVSRTGARGLMQLMPATASELGVQDAFVPEQNIGGGAAYLDQMLTRYHDNLALALAAYNAGPAAVDRYRGVPPYRETQLYVAGVIREFNRLKRASLVVTPHGGSPGD